ncbi:MAG: hypothetical protein HGA80_05030 [Candidatus Omnitrophica bacterium]|nr:hypothetical protein [Candidatus Omnitrophota bacterium]
MEDKIFRLAVLASFLIHFGFFVRFYLGKHELSPDSAIVSVKYKTEQEAPRYKQAEPETVIHQIAPSVRHDAYIVGGVPKNISQADGFFKDSASDVSENFKMYERQPERLKGLKLTREVSVPMLRSEKINSPSYVTYYQIVRDRIRERAYTNYTKLSIGEVYLTFIIKSDGSLGELQILDNKSTANDFLRDVGMKSVKEAAPFPSFPPDLSYPELTFNVAISFQYREE